MEFGIIKETGETVTLSYRRHIKCPRRRHDGLFPSCLSLDKIIIPQNIIKFQVKSDIDYVEKTLNCMANVKECKIAIYKQAEVWDRIRYFDDNEWIVIFAENGTLLTSHKKEIREQSFEEKHKSLGAKIKKGEINNNFREFFKRLRTKFRIF
jgi:hypothetical protein